MKIISFYYDHNSNVSIEIDGRYYIIELERITGIRYFNFIHLKNEEYSGMVELIINFIKNYYNIDNDFDLCIFPGFLEKDRIRREYCQNLIKSRVRAKQYINIDHHLSHAACGFYQSPYKRATIISFDGLGNDGKFNIYYGDESGVTLVKKLKTQSFGHRYRDIAFLLKDIHKLTNKRQIKNVNGYAGKLMGLVAYGTIVEEWIGAFEELYRTGSSKLMEEVIGIKLITQDNLLPYLLNNGEQYDGEFAANLAATNQYVFEKLFFEFTKDFIDDSTPIVLTGGCSLNVLLNEKIRQTYGNRVFICPNTDDSGISLGQILIANKPKQKINCTFSGVPILDRKQSVSIIENNFNYEPIDINKIASLLKDGKIIGVIQGDSEVGPRALGHRSILCDPSYPNMKDKLNMIKNREWFRPFAPIVRYEDREKFFEFDYEAQFMSFSPLVKKDFREKFSSITHVDGTARVQTIRRKDNPFLYELLGQTEGVLLNTSFNVNGGAIITRITDALKILKTTSLDYVLTEEYLIWEETNDK